VIFKQIKYAGDNFSYIIADATTREAVVVDPSRNAVAILRFLKEQKLRVKYIVNTHQHGDHVADNETIKSNFGAKIIAHKLSKVSKDMGVADGDVFGVGSVEIKVIHTPGHTPDGICLLADGKLLTGDTLFVGECGRTDLSGGSAEDMYSSLFGKLMKLGDDVEVYPGHDYGPEPHSTIDKEKRTNYTLQERTLEEFVEFMKEP
jgi:glyoxylase-like metal-dependent hydrolase (beta-lactamase superfamily II)